MDFKTLKYDKSNAVATITLNRPYVLNAMDFAMFGELISAMDEASADREIRAVVVTGAGRGFCSGADLRTIFGDPATEEPAYVRSYIRRINELINRMIHLDKPIVAAVNGPATGAGASVALASDIIYMSTEAYLSLIFIKRGLVPDFGGLYLLPRYVGMSKAKELIFTGDKVGADEALKLGIANRVCSPDTLMSEANEFATKLASGPTVALGLAKLGIHRGLESGLDAVLEYEALAQAVVRSTEDTSEAITSFLEKREPDFKGR